MVTNDAEARRNEAWLELHRRPDAPPLPADEEPGRHVSAVWLVARIAERLRRPGGQLSRRHRDSEA